MDVAVEIIPRTDDTDLFSTKRDKLHDTTEIVLDLFKVACQLQQNTDTRGIIACTGIVLSIGIEMGCY